MAQLKSTSVTGKLSVTGDLSASTIKKLGGTANEVLMADGSVRTDFLTPTNFDATASASALTAGASPTANANWDPENKQISFTFGIPQGQPGANGKDGKTPYIQDGYWYINGNNTNVKAEGVDGEDGADGEDGRDGTDGVGISSAEVTTGGELVLNFTNGTSLNLGKVVGTNGKDGTNGEDGTDGEDGKDGIDGKDGADGIGISSVVKNESHELVVTLTNGAVINLGSVKGEKGDTYTLSDNDKDTIAGLAANKIPISDYLKKSDAEKAYQPIDGDLTAIAALTGTSGLLKKTANNTWSLDTTSYAGSDTAGGAANSAKKLTTARNISLSQGASSIIVLSDNKTQNGVPFDGSSNIEIPVSSVKEAYLTWGGKSLSGEISPVGASLSSEHSANRLAYFNPNGLLFETWDYNNNTWVDSKLPYADKINHVTASCSFNVGYPDSEDVNTNHKSRMTLTAQNGSDTAYVYTRPKKLLINMSNNGHKVELLFEYRRGNSEQWTTLGTYQLSGWSGWNEIDVSSMSTLGGSPSQTTNIWQWRFTYSVVGIGTTAGYEKRKPYIIGLRLFGDTCWTRTSNMGETGHLYAYDYLQNATFPGTVKATGFIGNATTATKINTSVAIGNETKPIYISADGTPTACSKELGFNGGSITSDLVLYNDASTSALDSPRLTFQRGVLDDNYNDWSLYDTTGQLHIQQRGTGSTKWETRVKFTQQGAEFTGTISENGTSLSSKYQAKGNYSLQPVKQTTGSLYLMGVDSTTLGGTTYYSDQLSLDSAGKLGVSSVELASQATYKYNNNTDCIELIWN